MSNGKALAIASLLSGIFTAGVHAQNQPWRPYWGAVESRVLTCTAPQPQQRIAMDDFQYTVATTIKRVRWWGVVLDPAQAQLSKPFYVAIWANGTAGPCPGCNPSQVVAQWCLQPSTAFAGTDCDNRKVYRFTVCLPGAGFVAAANSKYWLQISELDAESARPGVEDFRWSGFRQPRLCNAQQRDAGGVVACAISDDCTTQVVTDLSYVLYPTCGVIILPPPVFVAPFVTLAEVRPAGAPSGTPPIVVEPLQFDDNGQGHLETELPDGQYEITLIGMGLARPKTTLAIQNGEGTSSFFDVFVGDLNNDGRADGLDVQPLVNGLLHP